MSPDIVVKPTVPVNAYDASVRAFACPGSRLFIAWSHAIEIIMTPRTASMASTRRARTAGTASFMGPLHDRRRLRRLCRQEELPCVDGRLVEHRALVACGLNDHLGHRKVRVREQRDRARRTDRIDERARWCPAEAERHDAIDIPRMRDDVTDEAEPVADVTE